MRLFKFHVNSAFHTGTRLQLSSIFIPTDNRWPAGTAGMLVAARGRGTPAGRETHTQVQYSGHRRVSTSHTLYGPTAASMAATTWLARGWPGAGLSQYVDRSLSGGGASENWTEQSD